MYHSLELSAEFTKYKYDTISMIRYLATTSPGMTDSVSQLVGRSIMSFWSGAVRVRPIYPIILFFLLTDSLLQSPAHTLSHSIFLFLFYDGMVIVTGGAPGTVLV